MVGECFAFSLKSSSISSSFSSFFSLSSTFLSKRRYSLFCCCVLSGGGGGVLKTFDSVNVIGIFSLSFLHILLICNSHASEAKALRTHHVSWLAVNGRVYNKRDKRNLIASFVHVTSLTGHFLIIALRALMRFFRSFFDTSIRRKKYYFITNQFVYKLFETEIKKKVKVIKLYYLKWVVEW